MWLSNSKLGLLLTSQLELTDVGFFCSGHVTVNKCYITTGQFVVIAIIAVHDAKTHAKSHLAASEVTPSMG